MRLNHLICCALMLLSTSCSYRTRTADPQLSGDELKHIIEEVQGANASVQTSGGTDFLSDPGATIYFADAPSPMGTVYSTLAFDDLSIFGSSDPIANIAFVRVLFVYDPAQEPNSELIIGLLGPGQDSTQFQYLTFTGDGDVQNGTFAANMSDGKSANFIVSSDDTDGANLASSIQLRVYNTDSQFVGKFSIMAGFQ